MLLELVIGKVKDESKKLTNPDDYQAAITAALKRYSKHRPRPLVADIPGVDGSFDYDLPADWQPELSAIEGVEFPAGLNPEVMLESRDYRLYLLPSGPKLRLSTWITPTAAETIRLTYTGLHTEESLPVADEDAVACLAASICCTQLAAAYGQTSAPLMQADAVNYGSKNDEYRRLAAFLEGQYKEHLGIKDGEVTPPAMATTPAQDTGRTRLTHWGRR